MHGFRFSSSLCFGHYNDPREKLLNQSAIALIGQSSTGTVNRSARDQFFLAASPLVGSALGRKSVPAVREKKHLVSRVPPTCFFCENAQKI